VQRQPKNKVEAGVGREFKEKTRLELAIASRESAKMKQSVQRVRMEEDLKCSTSREVNLSKQAYNQRADAFYARTKAALPTISVKTRFTRVPRLHNRRLSRYLKTVLPVHTTPSLLSKVSNAYRVSFHKIK